MSRLTSDAVLQEAFAWLCRQRRDWPAYADVWDLRRHWPRERARLQQELRAGTYKLGLLSRVTLADGPEMDLWSARDALVLKALALVLGSVLLVSRRCTHLKGHGGLKATVRQAQAQLTSARYVFKTDVRSYYASIDHHRLLVLLSTQIPDRRLLNLLGQSLIRRAERGGLIWDHRQGISLGCPLSPLLGAAFLTALDDQLARLDVWYRRDMDDLLVMASTRWHLGRAIRLVKQGLASMRLEPHPDKTWVGTAARGVEFLGYQITRTGPTVATAREADQAKVEGKAEWSVWILLTSASTLIFCWWRWAAGGLPDLQPCLTPLPPSIAQQSQ